jgi:hypothetical protein
MKKQAGPLAQRSVPVTRQLVTLRSSKSAFPHAHVVSQSCREEVSMLTQLSFTLIAALSIGSAAPAEEPKPKKALDPNEKVCETITVVGSRLATRKVCATRAEWADHRRQDREETEKAQRLGCLTQGHCGGN